MSKHQLRVSQHRLPTATDLEENERSNLFALAKIDILDLSNSVEVFFRKKEIVYIIDVMRYNTKALNRLVVSGYKGSANPTVEMKRELKKYDLALDMRIDENALRTTAELMYVQPIQNLQLPKPLEQRLMKERCNTIGNIVVFDSMHSFREHMSINADKELEELHTALLVLSLSFGMKVWKT